MLNAIMKNENKSFTNNSFFFFWCIIAENDVSDHELRQEIKILVKLYFYHSF